MDIRTRDRELVERLNSLTSEDERYWSFRHNSERSCSHDYFQYPAMMIPRMLSDLIRSVMETDSKVQTIFDPFAGSGTVLTEAMLYGKDFRGADINPLAVLLCKAKAGPFYPELLEDRMDELVSTIEEDSRMAREAIFPGIDKWFEPHIVVELSRIRRAIRTEASLWCRRFFWVALAETVRRTSNSRTSTFKLHIRSANDIVVRRQVSAIAVFNEVLNRNFESYCEQATLLQHLDLLHQGRYVGKARCHIRSAMHPPVLRGECDLLITSPPYGDNTTTVPYGQSSYLPLNWIDLQDIDHRIDRGVLRTTHEIDRRSLGGVKRNAIAQMLDISKFSPSLSRTLEELSDYPTDRPVRVAAFFRDLKYAIDSILAALRDHAYMIWVLGNRRVGGLEIPATQILSELLTHAGSKHVTTIHRSISSKRMALKNNVSKTMTKEAILIFRRN